MNRRGNQHYSTSKKRSTLSFFTSLSHTHTLTECLRKRGTISELLLTSSGDHRKEQGKGRIELRPPKATHTHTHTHSNREQTPNRGEGIAELKPPPKLD